MGKLAQTLAYGATVLAVRGDFDDAMRLVDEASTKLGIYLLNSINPFRIEGQRRSGGRFSRIWTGRRARLGSLPARRGNLGNHERDRKGDDRGVRGWLDRQAPAHRFGPGEWRESVFRGFTGGFRGVFRMQAETVASAIRIGRPCELGQGARGDRPDARRRHEVTDETILEAKAKIDGAGIGCEPASACSLAGASGSAPRE